MRTFANVFATCAMILFLSAFFLIIADAAFGKNNPRPTFDAAASYIAGKPVSVYCEDDQIIWDDYLWNDWSLIGSQVNGYTKPWAEQVTYLSPRVCLTLLLYLENDWRDAILFGRALHTFIHEAVHLRGNGIYDEHLTDCITLTKVREVAMKFFKVPESEKYTYSYLKYNKRGKLVSAKISKVEPSKFLRDLIWASQVQHNTAPAPYSGDC